MNTEIPNGQSGRMYWAIGFALFAPLGNFLAPILSGIVYKQLPPSSEYVVRENARQAANWVLTAAILFTASGTLSSGLMILSFVLEVQALFAVGSYGYFLTYAILLFHLVVTIWATIKAKHTVVRLPFSVKFYR